jgi:hypothetical protein
MANSDKSSRYLSVASGHIDSLISYVTDVKPYHTKLSEIVEEFLFEDSINVKIEEEHQELLVLGPDLLNRGSNSALKVWDKIGASRPADTLSAQRTVISDGTRRTFPIPLTTVPKLLSQSSQDAFVVGVNDNQQIPGLIRGVYSNRRFDGPGVPLVQKNGKHMVEGVDYHISLGAFSFKTIGGSKWKEQAVADLTSFAQNPGALAFNNVYEQFGSIVDIIPGTYEEFKLTWNGTALTVVGSISGNLGTCQFGKTFTSPKITFTFTSAYGDPATEQPTLNVGDTFILTPREKITVATNAPDETWTIIKTNPQALQAAPLFKRTSSIPAQSTPALTIYGQSLEWTLRSDWTITFIDATTYVISTKDVVNKQLAGYPKTVSLIDGCSFKDEFIHYTIVPPLNGFQAGDSFSFTIKTLKPNYLVYGSKSGWQAPATAGQWYWNGKIGFKIPKLDYYALKRSSTISTSKDGDDWQPVVVNGQELTNVSYINNAFIASGAKSIVAASTDGTSWSDDLTNFATIDKRLAIVGEDGLVAMTEDGETWYKVATHTTKKLKGITVIPVSGGESPNVIIVVGEGGTILTSINGFGWTNRESNVKASLNSIAYSNDWIIAVGDNGTILRSKDRITWTVTTSPTTENLNKVKFLNDAFWAVGTNGTIITSKDGVNWAKGVSNTTAELNDIAFGAGRYLAGGRGGVMCKSFNGITWTSYDSKPINAIEFGAEEQVFVTVEHVIGVPANFVPLRAPHSAAAPSMYTITFRSPVNGGSVVGGTVQNNLYGYRQGFKINENWQDEYCSFKIGPSDDVYRPGEQIDVYLVPKATFIANGNYDELPYDTTVFDTHIGKIEYPLDLLQEYFPLHYNQDALIFPNTTPADDGVKIIVDKAMKESIDFRIGKGAEDQVVPPAELAATNGWVPLEFRYYDRRINNDSVAEFPDLATYLDAYLASDPDTKVFTITQPRYKTTNRPAEATLIFDDVFFKKYLPERKYFSLRFNQTDSYSQTIRVKVSENLRIYARIRLNFDDIAMVKVSDITPATWETVAILNMQDEFNAAFLEGGFFTKVDANEITSIVPMPEPTISVKEKPTEIAGTNFSEGLQIVMRLTADAEVGYDTYPYDTEPYYDYIDNRPVGTILSVSLNYDVNTDVNGIHVAIAAEEYVVTHNKKGSTPTVIVYPDDTTKPSFVVFPEMIYTPVAGAQLSSFKFSVPDGTGPFQLTLA